ncbi:MAG: ABC transporter ATP-binding protein, partial [Chitinophagia bacterium]|nr:ABC transporter ATP-binding protein [Chitinophagia bacterium]
ITSYYLVADTGLAGIMENYVFQLVLWSGLTLIAMALLRGFFMFLMRQTIIVMSRLIEFDQKSEIYRQYQQLDTGFFKSHFTGDLMNRISEDVSRVRMYTGPSIMYFANMLVITVMTIWGMLRVNTTLTFWAVAPLPFLALSIYFVNRIIFKKSSKIQSQLSQLTTTAQESYSGIRVIKSFVQERYMQRFFDTTSADYRNSAINLSMTEAIYFPAMNLFIELSRLGMVLAGGYLAIQGKVTTGNIAEFVMYINLLMFPISSIGMVASMTQRAAASQQRIDEFLSTEPKIQNAPGAVTTTGMGTISLKNIQFTYPHTGITALKNFSLDASPGQKIALLGKTGSGKSTIAHLLLRMYDPQTGGLSIDGVPCREMALEDLRHRVGIVPQDPVIFSTSALENIR